MKNQISVIQLFIGNIKRERVKSLTRCKGFLVLLCLVKWNCSFIMQLEDFSVDFESLWNFKRNPAYSIQGYTLEDCSCYVLPR